VLDIDSSVSETHDAQEGSSYNGHFGCTCYLPLFVFYQFGDLERCALRPGSVHSADGWRDVLEPVIARYRHKVKRRYFRGDAAFANPEVYELLEAEGYKYTIRLPANSILQESIAWLLKRPTGWPPHEVRRYYPSFSYRAGSWTMPRRVVAKVEWHPGELYPRVGFIVTNMGRPAERVVTFYYQRGTAEQWIKEGKNAVTWTRLSCHRFAANAVRLQLHALAYNLANFLRTLALLADDVAPAAGEDRCQGGPPRPLGDFPDGRSHGAACVVPDDPRRYCGSPAVTAGSMLRIATPSSRRAYWRERRAQTPGLSIGRNAIWTGAALQTRGRTGRDREISCRKTGARTTVCSDDTRSRAIWGVPVKLYRSTDRLCRRGAAMKNLAHSASFHWRE
jgi:hypothetical protein